MYNETLIYRAELFHSTSYIVLDQYVSFLYLRTFNMSHSNQSKSVIGSDYVTASLGFKLVTHLHCMMLLEAELLKNKTQTIAYVTPYFSQLCYPCNEATI